MDKTVEDFLESEMIREDAVDTLIGSGYSDLIDIMTEEPHRSIFDNDETVMSEGGDNNE